MITAINFVENSDLSLMKDTFMNQILALLYISKL